MSNLTSAKIGGLALIVGALLAVIMILLRPGHILIERLATDATLLERVQTLAANATLTHLTSILIPLGSLLMLFGFFSLRRVLDGEVAAKAAFVRFAVMMLTFGIIGLAIANGLNHMIAHVINHGGDRARSLTQLLTLAVDIQAVKSGIILISGYGYMVGFASLAVGMYLRFRDPILQGLAFVAFGIAVAALIITIIADHAHTLSGLYRIATYANIPLTLWALSLGVLLYTEHRSMKADEP